MQPEIIKATLEFLKRVQLSGEEALTYLLVKQELEGQLKPQAEEPDAVEEAAKKTVNIPTTSKKPKNVNQSH